jgi:hypothetical protein
MAKKKFKSVERDPMKCSGLDCGVTTTDYYKIQKDKILCQRCYERYIRSDDDAMASKSYNQLRR